MDADLVLEGGGVKGIGLVGAISVLEQQGYVFHRIAGTSAGAIVGALVAADIDAAALKKIMGEVNYRDFQDDTFLDHAGIVGKAIEILTHEGIYKGDFLLEWLTGELAKAGKQTFKDLRLVDPGASPDLQHSYRLVVMTSDLSAGRLVRLPWDYQERLDCDPDGQKIAEAVRMSMSIPIFFRPWRVNDRCFVDGGMLSNFPVDVFDRTDDVEPRWPTFGIKLSARPAANQTPTKIDGPIELLKAMVSTMTNFHDGMYIDEPSVCDRTIFVDCGGVKATDFDLTTQQADALFASGQQAAAKFLSTWDFDAYKAKYWKPAHT
jgi:NTE family protein